MKINIYPIGQILSTYKNIDECPPNGWSSKYISIMKINKNYAKGLIGLKEGMIIHVFWWFHKAERDILLQSPKTNSPEIGVFSMRSPQRPNPIALSLCKIKKINYNKIYVTGLEAINKSLILDIKKAINYDQYIL
jgi:formylmethanofuran dehydrogenase subunit E